jgi:hypothetical protein
VKTSGPQDVRAHKISKQSAHEGDRVFSFYLLIYLALYMRYSLKQSLDRPGEDLSAPGG